MMPRHGTLALLASLACAACGPEKDVSSGDLTDDSAPWTSSVDESTACALECRCDEDCPREGYECRRVPTISMENDPKYCLMTDENML